MQRHKPDYNGNDQQSEGMPNAERVPLLTPDRLPQRLAEGRQPWQDNYYAMYSSGYGGIVTDPAWMLLPIDDHMVHRGDGVFEVFRCVDGALYNLNAHLDRLAQSARTASIAWPVSRESLIDRIIDTVRAGGHDNATVRVHVSRGPGGFSVDPSECRNPQLYIVVYRTPPPFMQSHPAGARAITFPLPMQPFTRPVIKSCNYLFNVLMKKTAHDLDADFAIARAADGSLAEGATENVACVTRAGELRLPYNRAILRGTTLQRAKQLARGLIRDGRLQAIRHDACRRSTLRNAVEIILFSTTLPVVAVTRMDNRPVGNGQPGPVALALWRAMEDDMRSTTRLRTLITMPR